MSYVVCTYKEEGKVLEKVLTDQEDPQTSLHGQYAINPKMTFLLVLQMKHSLY